MCAEKEKGKNMGVKFEYKPKITDVRGLSHLTAVGMMTLDWFNDNSEDTYPWNVEDVCRTLVIDVISHYILSCDVEEKSLTYIVVGSDKSRYVKFTPAETGGIDIEYVCGTGYSPVVRHWSVDQYCEMADDWYDDEDDDER